MKILEVDKGLYRGPRPQVGTDWGQLKALGIEVILNLERGWFEWFHYEMNREVIEAVMRLMTPLHIQMGDLAPPTRMELRTAVRLIQDSQLRGKKVYVHCLHGEDRTGMVCALYRVMQNGWPHVRAIDEMYANGFHQFPYEMLGWVDRLREIIREIRG